MTLPAFNEFLSNIDPDKMDYDLSMYSFQDMKEPYNPFSKEQYTLLVKTNITMTRALLSQYHQWLTEQLQSLDLKDS